MDMVKNAKHYEPIVRKRTKNKSKEQPMSELKLFVWTDFAPDYTGGLAFAIARDEIEARKLIVKENGDGVGSWGTLEIRPLNKKVARLVTGGA